MFISLILMVSIEKRAVIYRLRPLELERGKTTCQGVCMLRRDGLNPIYTHTGSPYRLLARRTGIEDNGGVLSPQTNFMLRNQYPFSSRW